MHHAKTYSPTIVISVSLRLGLMPRRPSLPLCVCRLDSALRCTPPSSWRTSGRAPICCSTPRMSALRSTPQCRNRSSGELYELQPSTTTIWTTHVLSAALIMSHFPPHFYTLFPPGISPYSPLTPSPLKAHAGHCHYGGHCGEPGPHHGMLLHHPPGEWTTQCPDVIPVLLRPASKTSSSPHHPISSLFLPPSDHFKPLPALINSFQTS